ncbi:hypothetical protein LY78DRAFT_710253 [Colletotrichum sublineola]|nr:hypothetical protein LY78DRAFT_710253 [Colletotrichum sublineola]
MVSNFWKCAILAQAFTSFTLAERVLIGFRVVSSDEAEKINEKSNIFRDPDYDDWAESRGSTQIGRGVYLAGSPTGWEGDYGDWYVTTSLTLQSNVWLTQFVDQTGTAM